MARPSCKDCGRPAMSKGQKNGRAIYRNICSACRERQKRSGFNYGIYKKHSCEFCGFIPVHSCQLDVDHVDGNRKNNCIENLQTLCANCHRLKTYMMDRTNMQIDLNLT
jgi:predicted HNH restriction endonuclease